MTEPGGLPARRPASSLAVGALAFTAAVVATVLLLAGGEATPGGATPVEYRSAEFAAVVAPNANGSRRLRGPAGAITPEPPAPGSVEWTPVDLPVQRGRGAGSLTGGVQAVVHWYRIEHPVGSDPRPLGVYLPRFIPGLGYADLYLNGEPVDVPALRAANHWNQPVLLEVPERVRQARDRLDVMLAITYDARTTYGLAPISVGPLASLQRERALRDWLQSDGPEALSYALLVVGLFAFGFWVRRPRETPYLLFALATAVWWIRTVHFWAEVVPLGSLPFWWLTVNSMSWLMVLVYLFALRFQGRRAPWAEYSLVLLVLVGGALTLPALRLEPATVASIAYLLQAVVAVGVTVLLTRDAVRSRTREAVVLSGALWINLGFGLYDLALKDALVDPRGVFLMPYGAVFLFGAFVYAVLRRYAAAIDDVERVNASLEDRLAARTRELEASHRKLLAIEREQTLAAERQRLMRDMHDGLGSSLMSSLVMVEQGRLQPGDVAKVLRECIDDLKLTIDSLEPIGADLVTLLATLRYRLGSRLEAAGLKLEWRVRDLPPLPWLDALSALEVLRMLQEALTNVIKHADANSIVIETRADDVAVEVVIADDGRGFDVEATTAKPVGRGLLNLERRARKLGGEVGIRSDVRGTVLRVRFPIDRRDPARAGEPVAVERRRPRTGPVAAPAAQPPRRA